MMVMQDPNALSHYHGKQVWQWLHHGAVLEDGRPITVSLAGSMMDANVEKLRNKFPERELLTAAKLYEEMIASPEFPEFLTLRAYDYLD